MWPTEMDRQLTAAPLLGRQGGGGALVILRGAGGITTGHVPSESGGGRTRRYGFARACCGRRLQREGITVAFAARGSRWNVYFL